MIQKEVTGLSAGIYLQSKVGEGKFVITNLIVHNQIIPRPYKKSHVAISPSLSQAAVFPPPVYFSIFQFSDHSSPF
jgi:hypothetical protein